MYVARHDYVGRELVRGESQHVRHDPHVALAPSAVAIRAEAGVGSRRKPPEEHGDVGERQPEPGGRRLRSPTDTRDVLPPTLDRAPVARVPHFRAPRQHRKKVVAQRLAVSQRRALPLALGGAQRDIRPSRRRVAREVNRVKVRHRRVPGDRRRSGDRPSRRSNAGRRGARRRVHALAERVHAHELPRPRPVPLPAHAAHERPRRFVLLVVGDVLDAEHAARRRRRREQVSSPGGAEERRPRRGFEARAAGRRRRKP
mmetsp:Transcript_4551/g.20659  ORF Transcript_4551/g.20659 Transcript_4551/m.20659 type:complete len:257 (+) Transcript_4551:1642-2412(+)